MKIEFERYFKPNMAFGFKSSFHCRFVTIKKKDFNYKNSIEVEGNEAPP